VDLDARNEPGELRQRAGNEGYAVIPQPVRKAVEQERVKTGIGKRNLQPARGRGVHGESRVKILFYLATGVYHVIQMRN
jgi:hypothetical protein